MGAQAVRLSNVDIDNALKNKDFEVLFQPIFDLGNGALARVETFVRWRHPKLGLLPPGAFISFFESQGRMSELTRYVLGSALKTYMDWRGPWPPGLSVNLALSDLSDDAFVSHFLKLLRDLEFPADLVTLECPMPPVDMPIDVAAGHFDRLSKTGARLAIEVRGRANDLLRSLDPFPFDEIKTGGSAILRFARTVRGPGLSAIADLLDVASNANAAITAVGVEDQASLSALRGLGFTAAQGNHLGKVGALKEFRPSRINEVRELLGLEQLSAENISALFRTEGPALKPSEPSDTIDTEGEKTEDAIIERLNERVAQFDEPAEPPAVEASPKAPAAPEAKAQDIAKETADADKKAHAKEKAKQLMLAKRAKARAARKAAAIERAKAKAAGKPVDEVVDVPDQDVTPPSPREMQEKVARAFDKDTAPETAAPAEGDGAQTVSPFVFTRDDLAESARAEIEQRQMDQRQAEAEPQEMKRAVGDYAPASAQPPASTENAMTEPVSLAVGSSGAYFRPGIRVGGPALKDAPHQAIPQQRLSLPSVSAEQKPAVANPAPSKSTVERAMEENISAPAANPAPAATPTPEAPKAEAAVAAPVDDALIGDLNKPEEETVAKAAQAAKPRRRKHFLQRKYVIVGNHFWPKSWKRAWKRRTAAKDEGADIQAAE